MGKLRHLCYRCFSCGRLMTALQIEKVWEGAERDTDRTVVGLCPCGGSKVTPTNPTPEETKKYESLWQKARYILGIRDDDTKLIELYYKRVKGHDLGPEYHVEG